MMELNKFESSRIELTIAECLNRSARSIGRWASISAVAWGLIFAAPLIPAVAAIPAYTLVGSYSKAVGGGGEGAAFDFDTQGRMVIMNGNQIYRQDAVNGSAFSPIGSVPAGFVDSFSGASFIRFSPDGTRLAIGNGVFGGGARVGIVSVAGLSMAGSSSIVSTSMDNYLATWADNQTLLVSGGAGVGAVFSPVDNSAISGRVIINGIDGASGGVAFNGTHVLAANGFDFGPGTGSNAGEIRAISLATALAAPTAIDFESGMAPIARVLSASPIEFDPFGNLLVGGGDVFGGSGDFGYAGIVDGGALAAALATVGGGGTVSPLLASSLNVLPPGVPANASTSLRFNALTNELLFTSYDNNTFAPSPTVYRFSIPAPGAGAMAVLALAGAVGVRRHRSVCASVRAETGGAA